jgi:diguanylate cyclase (GGDEF)-like protein
MKLSHKLTLTLILGISAFIALLVFKSFSMDYFVERNSIELRLKTIETAQQKLDYEILHNAFFLYTNQDTINSQIEIIRQDIESLSAELATLHNHPATEKKLHHYSEMFEKKVTAIYDFQTSNTVIKNTTAAIPLLQNRLFDTVNFSDPSERGALNEIHEIGGSILLGKNALDHQLIASLEPKIKPLLGYHFNEPVLKELTQRLLAHYQIIGKMFPEYLKSMEQVNDSQVSDLLELTKQTYANESARELRSVILFSYFLMALYILSLGIITFFLFRSEKESRIDTLTGLQNRKAYEERTKHSLKDLGLILINIRKFKHYNDFYGVTAGDELLIETAKHIRSLPFSGIKPTYYRLGADDFGILFETSLTQSLETLSKEVLTAFSKTPIIINGEIRTPSIVIAASTFKPLLETADMALKSRSTLNPIIYHEGLNLRQVIEDNVIKVQELKSALIEGRIIPYYQPIIDLSTCLVTKHEVLARVLMKDGQVRSILPYLTISKESNLYPDLTRTIIAQSFSVIAEHGGDFSINLSIEDISNIETVKMIEEKLQEYETIGKQIIFEILESEAIQEYDEIIKFIALMHRYGCRIAIDDFGSGYSNFSRILKLTIDIIKIDGSLIRYLDSDDKAITIVQTIVNFTKSASIQTVAEFVHNKAIAHIVSELGIDSAQGFYFYEPAPHPVPIVLPTT